MRESETATTVRATWDFSYKTSEVFAAAKRQAKHHADRYQWWEAESKKAEESLKAKGFEYREEQFSRGGDMVIVGDPQLVKRVTDCKRMMEDHQNNQELFEVWTRALAGKAEREPDGELVLKVDDVVFSGSKSFEPEPTAHYRMRASEVRATAISQAF